ncbi:MAG: GTP-binding protein, partial [Pseudomonadota bacterium]
WWASVPSERWPDNEALRNYLAANWEDPWGDRRQEIVFIGADIDWPALSARLDAALLPEGFDPDSVELDDPFPIWNRQDIQ